MILQQHIRFLPLCYDQIVLLTTVLLPERYNAFSNISYFYSLCRDCTAWQTSLWYVLKPLDWRQTSAPSQVEQEPAELSWYRPNDRQCWDILWPSIFPPAVLPPNPARHQLWEVGHLGPLKIMWFTNILILRKREQVLREVAKPPIN